MSEGYSRHDAVPIIGMNSELRNIFRILYDLVEPFFNILGNKLLGDTTHSRLVSYKQPLSFAHLQFGSSALYLSHSPEDIGYTYRVDMTEKKTFGIPMMACLPSERPLIDRGFNVLVKSNSYSNGIRQGVAGSLKNTHVRN
ncbi:hypothetical protein J437_LFUL016925 [Ladona fulva]|uniref:Uncharacterized protein n=1 Tax=Ladona fulva TaxID=123851 RepID=A0A8K0KUJ7_LADFU|nr:hypothetical protein J437_LFUL016925 [Ladona fulva]